MNTPDKPKPGAPPGNQNAAKADDEKLSSFLYIRALPADKARWVRAANRTRKNLTDWATDTLNTAAAQVLNTKR